MQISSNYNLNIVKNNYSINKIHRNQTNPNKISTQSSEILFKGLDLFGEINKDKIISAQGVTDEDKKHFIKELAELTYVDENNVQIPRFNKTDIAYLLVYIDNKQQLAEVKELAYLMKLNKFGKKVPMFISTEITRLLTNMRNRKQLEFVKELASITYTNDKDKKVNALNSSNIINIFPYIKNEHYLEFVKELASISYINDEDKRARVFDGYDIAKILSYIGNEQQMKIVSELANMTYLNENNKQVPRFKASDIENILILTTNGELKYAKELANMTYLDENNKQVPRFKASDIIDLIFNITNKHQLEFVKKFAKITYKNGKDIDIPRFDSFDILQIGTVYTSKNIANINKLSAFTYVNKNGNTVPMFNGKGIKDLITSYNSLNLADFMEYINTFDFKQLKQTIPEIKDFTPQQYLSFLKYNYQNGTTNFTREDLTLDKDFTNYLMQNYLNADDLTELLGIYPATDRKVGSMPNDWIKDFSQKDQKKIKDEIFSEIENFRKTNDIYEFASKMSKIFGKKVEVTKLGSGAFGTGYKISIDGTKDVCLKIFHNKEIDGSFVNMHGPYIEPQTGLFVNNHSNKFVKMYFGKVAPIGNNDAFLVTQFLSNETIPEENVDIQNGYRIFSKDILGIHNIINGKVIDFGAVQIEKKP